MPFHKKIVKALTGGKGSKKPARMPGKERPLKDVMKKHRQR